MTEDKYLDQIDKDRIPQHVAIIMDGNGRWAKQRNEQRSAGHIAGTETAKSVVETAARLGVKYLTLYTFSEENWNRPIEEVTALMHLLFDSLEEELLLKNDLCFKTIGDLSKLPAQLQAKIAKCVDDTKDGKRMTLVLALSYSSHWEIADTAVRLAHLVKDGRLNADAITPEVFSSHLTTSFMPNPDLLIRTGGELRLSNFLLWQCAYSELYFCDTYWPDFTKEEFYKAIVSYQNRERRYGKTSEQIS